ncbi:MAG TPA: glycoside hydrolase family 3 N-terminal domain-containing protein [Candidatus Dormibacteraeota bacterium]
MKRERIRDLVAFFVIAVVIAGTVVSSRLLLPRHIDSPVAEVPVEAPITSSEPDLGSLDEDIGSVMVVSWRGTRITPALVSLLEDDLVGGVLLFASNFNGAGGLRALTAHLQALGASACLDHPILVMIDEEGGRVNRVSGGFAPPSQLVAGAGGPAHVRALERASGAGLRELGIGLNLAPVADVRTNSRDEVIGDRSFGSNPAVVGPLVAAAVDGLHDGGVGATLKHFPGLGGAAGDPHFAIPTDPESEQQWEQTQLPAFQAGIAAGVDAVMTTAVYVPGLGAGKTPALFYAPVIDRLRTQMAFGGAIITDSLSMGGIGVRYSLPQAAVLALAAGNDMLLLGNGDLGYERAALAAVREAVLSGRIDRAKLHASAMRVNHMRDRWGERVAHCHSRAA